jgi:two-component system response regulator CssR
MSFRIFLVENEPNLNQVLTSYLQKEGWDVTSFLDGEPARQAIAEKPDLWILDIMLPNVDGYELIRLIKQQDAETPVIFISARDAELDRVVGLEMGSDDYLPKPFLPRELVIRTKKLLARIYGKPEQSSLVHEITVGPYTMNETARTVRCGATSVDITTKEFDFLLLFVKNMGQALSREQILQHIWGYDFEGTDRVVDDLVRRLRKKLPELPLETMYGYGYRLVKS